MGKPTLQGEVQQQHHTYGILPPPQEERDPETSHGETSKSGLSTMREVENPYEELQQPLEACRKRAGAAFYRSAAWRRREVMTTQHRYSPVGQGEGLPQTLTAAELWKFAFQRKFVWVACLVLLLPLVFTRKYPEPLTQEVQEVSPPLPAPDVTKLIDFSVGGCNIWKGDWIPHPDGPAYTNTSCHLIQEHQNCMKNGRPDLGFLYWRWKPHNCELPLFDAKAYLDIVAGKKWAFIGDSIARNHFQSFLCSLAQVEVPDCTFNDGVDRNVYWHFKSFNFTLVILWAPFLVKGTEDEAEGYAQGIEKLHLDVVDESWAPSLHNYDYIVLSSGQWFLKTSVYFVENKLVGCHYCPTLNITEVGFYYAYRVALRTVFDFLISSNYKGVVFFRTFTPDHFENGRWDNGGNCTRTVPFESKSTVLEGMTSEMYKIQLEEYGKTLQRSAEYSFKLRIVDTIHASLLRPDAHPGPYRHFQPFAHDKHAKVQNDCLHWCLPGAIDTWSAMLLDVLKHL
ncbi:hypothetical protein L7F22_012940 [Adiantum nelumboides]|nr:hypothetical protein [Adiantum nelumboides]